MKTKDDLRIYVDEAIEYAESIGLDLTTDYMDVDFTYPDIPYVKVTLTIGGMFPLSEPEGDVQ